MRCHRRTRLTAAAIGRAAALAIAVAGPHELHSQAAAIGPAVSAANTVTAAARTVGNTAATSLSLGRAATAARVVLGVSAMEAAAVAQGRSTSATTSASAIRGEGLAAIGACTGPLGCLRTEKEALFLVGNILRKGMAEGQSGGKLEGSARTASEKLLEALKQAASDKHDQQLIAQAVSEYGRSRILMYQSVLRRAQHYSGSLDGIPGERTLQAMNSFSNQRRAAAEATAATLGVALPTGRAAIRALDAHIASEARQASAWERVFIHAYRSGKATRVQVGQTSLSFEANEPLDGIYSVVRAAVDAQPKRAGYSREVVVLGDQMLYRALRNDLVDANVMIAFDVKTAVKSLDRSSTVSETADLVAHIHDDTVGTTDYEALREIGADLSRAGMRVQYGTSGADKRAGGVLVLSMHKNMAAIDYLRRLGKMGALASRHVVFLTCFHVRDFVHYSQILQEAGALSISFFDTELSPSAVRQVVASMPEVVSSLSQGSVLSVPQLLDRAVAIAVRDEGTTELLQELKQLQVQRITQVAVRNGALIWPNATLNGGS